MPGRLPAGGGGPPLLQVSDLSVTLHTETATVRPVRNVSYELAAGETLAIVGESGSGKTISNLAPLGLLPSGVVGDLSGSFRLDGQEIIGLDGASLQKIRGRKVGVIFQDPLSALNPARRVGGQITEVLTNRLGLSHAAAQKRAVELLALVGIPDAAARLRQYPHELSGGMRQRVMIASAIAGEPRLLIADEPTTALDVTVQAQIVDLLIGLQRQLGMAIVLITHDIGVVAGMADRIAIMYAGHIVEQGRVDYVVGNPRHPYTQGLLAAIPSAKDPVGSLFRGLPGQPPDLMQQVRGCPFAPRCTQAIPSCRETAPVLAPIGPTWLDHLSACPVVLKSSPVLEASG